jgi:signal transduction histidine kinase
LAISRDFARGMGGELTVESEVDVGSVFTLTLPRG